MNSHHAQSAPATMARVQSSAIDKERVSLWPFPAPADDQCCYWPNGRRPRQSFKTAHSAL